MVPADTGRHLYRPPRTTKPRPKPGPVLTLLNLVHPMCGELEPAWLIENTRASRGLNAKNRPGSPTGPSYRFALLPCHRHRSATPIAMVRRTHTAIASNTAFVLCGSDAYLGQVPDLDPPGHPPLLRLLRKG
jgi:hypothetical protein